MIFSIVFESRGLNENASIKIPGKDRINFRIVQSVGDSAKVHGIDIKMFDDKSGGSSGEGSIALYVDPNTMLIDRDKTEDRLNKHSTKDKRKFYKDNIDVAAGAILYAKDELIEFFENEKNRVSAEYDKIYDKMNDFSNLYKSDRSEFKKYINMAKGKEPLKEEFSIGGNKFELI